MFKLHTFQEQYHKPFDSPVLTPKESYCCPFPKKRNGELHNCFEIYPVGDTTHVLKLSYFVGVDWIIRDELAIYIAPKLNTKLCEDGSLDQEINHEDIQQTDYLKMLFSALKHPEITDYTEELYQIKWDAPQLEITHQEDILTPLLVVEFLRVVQSIVRKGLKKSYYKIESNLNSRVKGKLMVAKTIKQNLLKNKPLNTFCSYDEFGINGLENRLIKKALVFVQKYLPSIIKHYSQAYTTTVFNYINPAFEDVSEQVSLHDVIHNTKTNIFYKEYEQGIRLAKQILRRFGFNISNTQQAKIKTPPFWIDMSKLFELYVLAQLKEKHGNIILYGKNAQGNFSVIPDYLQINRSEEKIIDAKYKQQYKAKNIYFDEYLIKDIRQVSGYARDKAVLSKLGIADIDQLSYIPQCLIIYPDQNASEHLYENKVEEIPEFVNFFKQAIRLPTL